MWTFDCLDEDHESERFFSGLPGFRSSKMVKDPVPDLNPEQQEKLLNTLIGLSDRTSSDLLPEQVKVRRSVACAKAIGPTVIHRQTILGWIVSEDQYGPVRSAEIAHLVRGWDDGQDGETAMIIQAIVWNVVARAQRRDDIWFAMAAEAMCLPKYVLRNHAKHGNDLSLTILIYLVRQQFGRYWVSDWPWEEFSKVLEAASKFNVLDTSPDLQHEFCELWNQVVCAANGTMMPWCILKPIRNVYLTLHLHTDCTPTRFSVSTSDEDRIAIWQSPRLRYPLCDISGHHPDLTPRLYDSEVSTPMTIPCAALHDNAALVPSSLPSANAPSPPLTRPVHINENAVGVPLIDNMLAPAPLTCAHQTSTENFHGSATSPDPAVAATPRDNSPAQPMTPTIRAASTFPSSIPSPSVVSFLNNVGLTAHSGEPEILSSVSPESVLDDITSPSVSLTLP